MKIESGAIHFGHRAKFLDGDVLEILLLQKRQECFVHAHGGVEILAFRLVHEAPAYLIGWNNSLIIAPIWQLCGFDHSACMFDGTLRKSLPLHHHVKCDEEDYAPYDAAGDGIHELRYSSPSSENRAIMAVCNASIDMSAEIKFKNCDAYRIGLPCFLNFTILTTDIIVM